MSLLQTSARDKCIGYSIHYSRTRTCDLDNDNLSDARHNIKRCYIINFATSHIIISHSSHDGLRQLAGSN